MENPWGEEALFETLFDMFSRLPRQGPGLDSMTREAFQMLPLNSERPKILEIGCGTGVPTRVLAKLSKGSIVATDLYQPYLDTLMKHAGEEGVADQITTRCVSMDSLDFPAGSFDLIWSEGSIFVVGFETGLRNWRKFLTPDGCLVCSEITWRRPDAPDELRDYWDSIGCLVQEEATNCHIAKEAGYEVLATKWLDARGWWKQYYTPFEELSPSWSAEMDAKPKLRELVEAMKLEIDMFRKYSDYYGYTFYLLRNRGE